MPNSLFNIIIGLILLVPGVGWSSIELPANFTMIDVLPALQMLADTEGRLSLAEVRQVDGTFHPVTHTHFPRSKAAIWTRVELRNLADHSRDLLLMNPSPYINEISLFVVRSHGDVESYELGSFRRHNHRALQYRYDVQPVAFGAGETVLVYTRHVSINALEINTRIYTPNSFLSFVINDAVIWGIYGGIVAILVFYAGVAGFALRQLIFVSYMLHAGAMFLLTLTLQGEVLRLWMRPVLEVLAPALIDLPGPIDALISRTFLMIGISTASWFALMYFDYSNRAPRVSVLLKLWMAVAFVFIAADIAGLFWPVLTAAQLTTVYALPLFLFSWLGIAWYAAWRRFPGWRSYLFGTGSFIVLAILQDVEWLGLNLGIPEFISVYGTAIGLVLELVFLSWALGARIRRIQVKYEANERLLLEQSKFSSAGQVVSAMVHQLKRPIIYAGNHLMKLEQLLDSPLQEREAKLPEVVAEMRRHVDFMNKTVVDIYNFFADDRSQRMFHPAEQIEQVTAMLRPVTTGEKLQFDCSLRSDLMIMGYPSALAHALLILLENAAQVLKDRAIADPLIRIVMTERADNELILSISDNGGGIQVRPIEKIFELYTSHHAQGGMGIGLPLARRIIEQKFKGSISVHNRKDGAAFIVSLPMTAGMIA